MVNEFFRSSLFKILICHLCVSIRFSTVLLSSFYIMMPTNRKKNMWLIFIYFPLSCVGGMIIMEPLIVWN